MKIPRCYTTALLALMLLLSGCLTYRAHAKQSGSDVGPSDIRPEPGDTLHVSRDSVLMKTQGTTLTAMAHHKLAPATWIRLAPKGASVRAVDPEGTDFETSRTDALGDRNPWFFVEVIESPRPEQVGWRGWVHNSAFSKHSPESKRSPREAELAEKAWVCPDGNRMGINCEVTLPPGQPVEVYECKRFAVGVGTWNEEGHYLFGWIPQPRLATNPCD